MKPWIKRTLIGTLGLGVLFGGLAACSHHAHHKWPATEAEAAQMRPCTACC
jgi:hypothetical protein